ncbi:MAG: amidohydrolase family protein [Alphaproteobacteria bacterium]|nr:amidohydrolase family protein [Alphaproteobacteria bacterium]
MKIDAHQHFWNPARGDYGWLTPDNSLYRTFGPDDLAPQMRAAGVEATILVQAAPTAAESDYLLDITRRTPWVLGIVGWIDLEAPDAAVQVKARAANPLFLGLRPMLQDIAQRDWILESRLAPALTAVAEEGLVFDALVRDNQVSVVDELAGRYPTLAIVLDHGAKPKLGNASAMAAWGADIAKLARRTNVCCKLSGLVTELSAGDGAAEVKEAAEVLFAEFGPQRLIWGSDWPVLTSSHFNGNYHAWHEEALALVAAHGATQGVMGGNAARIYKPMRAKS